MEFICRIPTIEEVNERWQFLLESNEEDRVNWEHWRREALYNFAKGSFIIYYGFLDGKIICEATAIVNREAEKNTKYLIGEKRAYLSAFRTDEEYRGQGYFSKLFKYMISDLKEKGYEEVTLGVEPTELKNLAIYNHYGFNEYVESEDDVYPNGEVVHVDYYMKKL